MQVYSQAAVDSTVEYSLVGHLYSEGLPDSDSAGTDYNIALTGAIAGVQVLLCKTAAVQSHAACMRVYA